MNLKIQYIFSKFALCLLFYYFFYEKSNKPNKTRVLLITAIYSLNNMEQLID